MVTRTALPRGSRSYLTLRPGRRCCADDFPWTHTTSGVLSEARTSVSPSVAYAPSAAAASSSPSKAPQTIEPPQSLLTRRMTIQTSRCMVDPFLDEFQRVVGRQAAHRIATRIDLVGEGVERHFVDGLPRARCERAIERPGEALAIAVGHDHGITMSREFLKPPVGECAIRGLRHRRCHRIRLVETFRPSTVVEAIERLGVDFGTESTVDDELIPGRLAILATGDVIVRQVLRVGGQ